MPVVSIGSIGRVDSARVSADVHGRKRFLPFHLLAFMQKRMDAAVDLGCLSPRVIFSAVGRMEVVGHAAVCLLRFFVCVYPEVL
jgi:hypothetical protein